ncbi:MAG: hypothetical protein DHS20C21_18160 [Gemmatimonadota bacterium]|nr:MAG: hypothetical protein DHS20C21_18160 [Gemmatimonadota bacterium]
MSVCISGPGIDNEFPLTTDCDLEDPREWLSDGRGYGEVSGGCLNDGCGCEYGTQERNCYTWTVSSSSSNPYATIGELPDGQVLLFLWIRCSSYWEWPAYWSSVAMDVEVTGADYLGVFPDTDFVVSGSKTSPVFTAERCTSGGRLVGGFLLYKRPTPVEPYTWGRVKALYR